MTDRVALGSARGAFGLWVSKPGYDVLSTSEGNLLFSMGSKTTSVYATGTVTFPANANGQQVVVPISLPFGGVPMVNVTLAVRVGAGTESVYVTTRRANADNWNTDGGGFVYVTSSYIQFVCNANINYSYVFFYTIFTESR